MTIIPRALVNHQLRCDVQDCHACGGDHVGMMFAMLPKPYGSYNRFAVCSKLGGIRSDDLVCNGPFPVLMRESDAGPFAEAKE